MTGIWSHVVIFARAATLPVPGLHAAVRVVSVVESPTSRVMISRQAGVVTQRELCRQRVFQDYVRHLAFPSPDETHHRIHAKGHELRSR